MKRSVLSKKEFYQRWGRGEFGNAGLNFPTPEAAQEWARTTDGEIAIRTTRAGGGPFCPNLKWYDIPVQIVHLECKGYSRQEMQFSAMMPDHLIRVQGYVYRGVRGLELDYNLTPGINMRQAMKYPLHAHGLKALEIIRWACDPSDYDDLMALLDEYDDHVVEFTAYQISVGNCPRRNTVIWEVRKY